MKHETIVKSIIYGNSCSNNYGVFRALCAAITDKCTSTGIQNTSTRLSFI
jgi:hypothetical protein